MPCQACAIDDGLEVCLFCGHSFCSRHRGEAGGVPACTQCLKAEAERRRAPPREPARLPTRAARPAASEPPRVQVEEKPPAPLPEPKSVVAPLLCGLGAALAAAGYVYWMIPKIVESSEGVELSDWVQPIGAGASALVVFLGTWAIAKTKL